MASHARDSVTRLARSSRTGLITVAEAAESWGVARRLASARLAHLQEQGWVRRVRRGLYLVLSLEADARSPVTIEDPWLLAREIYAPCYVGGWSAAEFWELTDQVFGSTFVVTAANVRTRQERVLAHEFRLVRVSRKRIEGAESTWRGQERVPVSGRERTLADGLVSPDWVGGVRHLVDMLRVHRERWPGQVREIATHLKSIGRGSGFKRFGFLLESLYPEESRLIAGAHRRSSSGTIKLDPSVRSRGRLNTRWGLWMNVRLPDEPS